MLIRTSKSKGRIRKDSQERGFVSPERAAELKRNVESSPEFKAHERNLAAKVAMQRAERHQEYENHPDVTAWRGMTKEEQTRNAIDRMTKGLVERFGSEEKARKHATELAYKSAAQGA